MAIAALLASVAGGCASSTPGSGNKGSGGVSGTGGTGLGEGGRAQTGGAGGSAVGGGDGSLDAGVDLSGDDGAPVASCPEAPAPRRATGTVLDLGAEFVLGGKPLLFAEANAVPGGGTLTPSNLRFYVSEVSLQRSDVAGGPVEVPVDLVTTAGAPEPYGVHLVNADDAESLHLRLLAPAGSYTGITFTLGLSDSCNRGSSARKPPLSETSQMTWPPPFGYLFLRFESQFAPPAEGDGGAVRANIASVIYMGGLPGSLLAPVVRAEGALSIPASSGVTGRLRLVMDEVFKGATADLATGTPVIGGSEVQAGESLRQRAPSLPLFVLESP